jgi:hypothetical protein
LKLPIYYGYSCLRVLPILDLIICRLIEVSDDASVNLLFALLQAYAPLYAFHESAAEFVLFLLHYYYSSKWMMGGGDGKLAVLQLASKPFGVFF